MDLAPSAPVDPRLRADQRQPTSFTERGITLPLTTTALFGCRLRAPTAAIRELLMPHPRGGRGVFVLGLSTAPDMAPLTMHDRELISLLASMQSPSPAGIREAARRVATDGWAGRPAIAAAREAQTAVRNAGEAIERRLLEALAPGASRADPPAFRAIAQRLDLTEGGLRGRIRALASLMARCGWSADDTYGIAARMARLSAFAMALDPRQGGWARDSVLDTLRQLLAHVEAGLAELLRQHAATLASPWEMLRHWLIQPEATGRVISRADWLLDGWDALPALWRMAPAEAKPDSLPEILALTPTLPLEAESLPGIGTRPPVIDRPPPPALPANGCRVTWQQERVSRAEKLRALLP